MITRRQLIRLVLIVVAFFAAINLIRTFWPRAITPLPAAARFTLSIPDDRTLDAFALSRDGRMVAYSAEFSDGYVHLFLKTDNGAERILAAVGISDPFFSPDGNSLAYFRADALWKASVGNLSDEQKICDVPGGNAGGTWGDDGRIVFAPLGGQGLMTVPSTGGTPKVLTTLNKRDAESAHGWPHAVAGGGVVFTVAQRGRDPHLEMLSPSNDRSGRLVPAIGQAQYESTGHLVYSYLGNLYAVVFNIETMKTGGAPVALAKGVQTTSGFDQLGHSGFALSQNGTLAWVRSTPADADGMLVRARYDGIVIDRLAAPAAPYQTPRLSPDGKRLAVAMRSGFMTREIKVVDAQHPERLLFALQGGDNQSPAWMPDGRLSFSSNRDGLQKIYVASADGKRLRPLFSMDVGSPRNPGTWIRHPPLLAFYEIDPFRARDVMVYQVGEAILPVEATAANERSPALSPDGRSIAYVSDQSGRDEVYVKGLEDGSQARQLSQDGGVEPVWNGDGLFYREGDRLLRWNTVDGRETTMFEARRFENDPGANAAAYDIDPRRKVLVMMKSARKPKEIRIVRNWGTELTQQVPGK